MRPRTRHICTAALLLLVAGPVAAQQREREEQRAERLRQAEHQAQEAMRELESALRELRESRSEQAREQLEQAMEALRRAQRQLGADYRGGLVSVFAQDWPNVSFLRGRPRLGVEVRSGSNSDTDAIGAEILRVTPDGPADEAGLEAGDIITRANGVKLARSGQQGRLPGSKLIDIIGALEEGDSVAIDYRRGGETRSAKIELRNVPMTLSYRLRVDPEDDFGHVQVEPRLGRFRVEPPDVEVFTPGDRGRGVFLSRLFESGWMDIELVTLNDELGEYFGTSEGLLVLEAPDDESLKLRSGDVILSIDGRKPTSPSHAMRIIRSYEAGESFELEIMRQKRRTKLTAVIPEREDEPFFRQWQERGEH